MCFANTTYEKKVIFHIFNGCNEFVVATNSWFVEREKKKIAFDLTSSNQVMQYLSTISTDNKNTFKIKQDWHKSVLLTSDKV